MKWLKPSGCALFILLCLPAFGQEEKAVMASVNTLFEGMKKGDSAMMRTVFHPQARLFSVSIDQKTHEPVLKGDPIKGFLNTIGTPHKEVYNEMIWSPKIEIDGNLAQVWVFYAFYLDKTFHHCGIDAFQLFKDAKGQWKIFHLADTRQKEGCVVPPEVSDKMK